MVIIFEFVVFFLRFPGIVTINATPTKITVIAIIVKIVIESRKSNQPKNTDITGLT